MIKDLPDYDTFIKEFDGETLYMRKESCSASRYIVNFNVLFITSVF